VTATEFEEIRLFDIVDKPYGLTYGAWTAKWWSWILSIPKEINPLCDENGEDWNVNQPESDVWYLVGNFAREFKKGETRIFPRRRIIKMQSGRSILFPVLNCIASFLEYFGPPKNLQTHDDLLRHVDTDVNSVVKKELFINNRKYVPVRISSDPKIFRLKIIEGNALEINNSGITDAAADGFWVFIKSLSRGHYTIKFEGSCENGRLCAGASYEIDVV
jgi:hypothetical protein